MKLKEAMEIVINYLDDQMISDPTKELADLCNYLQASMDELDD